MLRIALMLLACIISNSLILAQAYRSYNGTGNNPNHYEYGAVGSHMSRLVPAQYGDGISSLKSFDRPNPRLVSSTLFQQDSLKNDPLKLSDYTWVWGQFIDHDITLGADGFENLYVGIPACDAWFDPDCTGQNTFYMRRSLEALFTGTNINNPREYANAVTTFIDASSVYGSDMPRANWLRTFEGGKLKTSEHNFLPFNTVDSEYNSALDPAAPHMATLQQTGNKYFVAGDERANENLLLLSFHTLFMREHNRIVEELGVQNPSWTDEQLYQHGRKLVGGLMQEITYKEWLPAMGMEVPAYTGYDVNVDPAISNEFSVAAFRLGHTLLNSKVPRMMDDGSDYPDGHLLLRDAFFQINELRDMETIDPFFKGIATQVQQDMDSKVISDVRNFLFGDPGFGGLDLATINIARGRERGLSDFNSIRAAIDLPLLTGFDEMSFDPAVNDILEDLYGDVDEIDPWVGMLTEYHMPGALFGETMMEIMKSQFMAIRDGDRFYFENDNELSVADKSWIQNSLLSDIIKRNTDLTNIQDNVFYAKPHDMLCTTSEPSAALGGLVLSVGGAPITGATVDISNAVTNEMIASEVTTAAGAFMEAEAATCEGYTVLASKNDGIVNGVTTYDLVLMQKHILGLDPFTAASQYLAADANASGSITTFDMVLIRKVILQIDDSFPNNTSWRFFEGADYFAANMAQVEANLAENINVANLQEATSLTFTGVKVGDVNASVNPEGNQSIDDRNVENAMVLQTTQRAIQKGEQVEVHFTSADIANVEGFQCTFEYDKKAMTYESLRANPFANISDANFGIFEAQGLITASWNGKAEVVEGMPLFSLTFKANKNGQLSEFLQLNDKSTRAEAYTQGSMDVVAVQLDFVGATTESQFVLYQNTPNPITDQTTIAFDLPQAMAATLTITDVAGKVIYTSTQDYSAGRNQLSLSKNTFPVNGVYFYQLSGEGYEAVMKLTY